VRGRPRGPGRNRPRRQPRPAPETEARSRRRCAAHALPTTVPQFPPPAASPHRMRAKLREIKATLRRRMHEPIPEQGKWLGQSRPRLFQLRADLTPPRWEPYAKSRTYGPMRGACDETHIPTATRVSRRLTSVIRLRPWTCRSGETVLARHAQRSIDSDSHLRVRDGTHREVCAATRWRLARALPALLTAHATTGTTDTQVHDHDDIRSSGRTTVLSDIVRILHRFHSSRAGHQDSGLDRLRRHCDLAI